MRAVDIITKKRDGEVLSRGELEFFLDGYVRGDVPDYQASALCMAILFRGMTPAETADLTHAMAHTGSTLDLHDVAPFVVDKHSSGGVGDKTTLVVAPLVASHGIPVGKMSGRGLSFSGGTLDKLEAIPGFEVYLSVRQFKQQLREIGLVIAGQSMELAPADGKLYSLRDVTGTVPSLPLIASSIMSKKIAAGADAIVLDVKTGHGAFMETKEEAIELATLMVEIGTQLGRKMAALIGDMSQPLGLAVGNALEVVEAVETLRGGGPGDFRSHCVELAAEMLRIAGRAPDSAAGARLAAAALDDGTALEKFRQLVETQHGDVRAIDRPGALPQAPLKAVLPAPQDGWVASIDAREVGFVVVELGGGRARKEDAVDPAVGIVLAPDAKVGAAVTRDQPLLTVYARTGATLEAALQRLRNAYVISDHKVAPPAPIHRVIG